MESPCAAVLYVKLVDPSLHHGLDVPWWGWHAHGILVVICTCHPHHVCLEDQISITGTTVLSTGPAATLWKLNV